MSHHGSALHLPLAIVVLSFEAAHFCSGQDGALAGEVSDGQADSGASQPHAQMVDKQEDVSPGVMHWVLAVILSVVLISGLIRVYRVLQMGDSMTIGRSVPEGMRPVECGACHTMQYVTTHGRIFICFGCRSANRIPIEVPNVQQQELFAPTGPLKRYEFRKGGENFWQELKQEEIEDGSAADAEEPSAATPTNAAAVDDSTRPQVVGRQATDNESNTSHRTDNDSQLPQCVVCLDSLGCMVLLPCAHGSVCEECVTRIAQNKASGGAHCPHCRSIIQTLVKINELSGDIAKGIEYRIPIARPL